MDYNGSSTFNIFQKHIYSVALHRLPQNLIYLMDSYWLSQKTFFLLLWEVMLKSMFSWQQTCFPQRPAHTHLLSLDFVMIYEEIDSYFHLYRFKCIILSNLWTFPVCFQKTSIQRTTITAIPALFSENLLDFHLSDLIFPPGLPGGASSKEFACKSKGHRFDPWVGNISRKRKWHPTPAFLPEEFHGQRSLVGCSPCGRQRVEHDWVSEQQQQQTLPPSLPAFWLPAFPRSLSASLPSPRPPCLTPLLPPSQEPTEALGLAHATLGSRCLLSHSPESPRTFLHSGIAWGLFLL